MLFSFHEDDLNGEQMRALLTHHLAQMHANSPPGSVFALDLSGLQRADVTVWGAWDGEVLVAVGALRALADGNGELKSMRTHPDHLRRGAATQMLEHIMGVARGRGMRRLSLETGSGESFEPALALYRRHGFVAGTAFADYIASDFNQFFHLDL